MTFHSGLENIAFLAVELGDTLGMLREALVSPTREYGKCDDLCEGIRLQVCYRTLEVSCEQFLICLLAGSGLRSLTYVIVHSAHYGLRT